MDPVAATARTAHTALSASYWTTLAPQGVEPRGLSATVIQTIDPDEAFGGHVTTGRVAIPSEGSLDAMLSVSWNGDMHVFHWDVTKIQ